jgi:hypothetical protein
MLHGSIVASSNATRRKIIKKKGTYNGKKGKDIVLGRANLVVASFIVWASHYNNSLRLFWRNVLLFGSHGF